MPNNENYSLEIVGLHRTAKWVIVWLLAVIIVCLVGSVTLLTADVPAIRSMQLVLLSVFGATLGSAVSAMISSAI